MLAPLPLPPGFLLRPAQAIDKPFIRRMLMNLEQEITPANPLGQWLVGGLILTIVALVGIRIALPGARVVFQPLLGLILLASMMLLIAALVSLRHEWMHYWVVEHDGSLVACAKLQHHSSYSVLYDLYVLPEWRKQGIGSYLVSQLGQQVTQPLYLACLPERLPFYKRLGFAPVAPKRLPPLLQYELGLPGRPGIIPLLLMKP